ncbi:MAG TPA: V-type ATP synthase subunit E family protein [Blastococcus sp.]|jgi:vacuolar-type H+-ATPase subunit H|nr:V-type ATP synthase subunit E family protein [Blastococcus sp.]
MTRPTAAGFRSALAPVREGLLAQARADADATLAAADADAAVVVATAREQAATILDEARTRGERDAAVLEARERARGRREARSAVLQAQRDAYEELRRTARAAARQLRADPRYPDLVAALTERARVELGPGATVHEHPDGGVVAAAAGRRLDGSLEALADRALTGLGPDVQGLWGP